MSDEQHRRPFDHHVEPLFAGLGLEEHPSPRPGRTLGAGVVGLLVVGASALVLWWLT